MMGVWALCIVAYSLLPFQLLLRNISWQGVIILIGFIGAYVIGTLIVPTEDKVDATSDVQRLDSTSTETWLKAASLAASLLLLMDATGKSLFDLAASYDLRSQTADALLHGEGSISSTWFKLAFLLYPAGYVYLAVHIMYAEQVKIWKLAIFGLLPIALATLAMGGRMPILYALIVIWLSLRERKKIGYPEQINPYIEMIKEWIKPALWILAIGLLFYYFAVVFIVRAAVVGGAMEMFAIAEDVWGVGFFGYGSQFLFSVLGEDLTYLFFIFSWYFLQGFVMSNYIFSAYEGPAQMGAYGLDLMSAVIRRLDPQGLAEGFNALLELGTYGFFPSAWGTLYVDFGFFGLIFCVTWGLFNGLCYQRIVNQRRMRWLMFGPFVSLGIFFSVINTPLGFSNGFITYFWLMFAFLWLGRNQDQDQDGESTSPSGSP